jgi:hypothetical protein
MNILLYFKDFLDFQIYIINSKAQIYLTPKIFFRPTPKPKHKLKPSHQLLKFSKFL